MDGGKKKNIVVLGGANGCIVALRALKRFSDQLDIRAVVSVADSGGSSGILRERYGVLPPSDLMRAVLALSTYDFHFLKEVFVDGRMAEGPFGGHSLGNLFLTWAANETGDIRHGIRALETILNAQGHVFPVSLDSIHLAVQLSDGSVVNGEGKIDRPSYDRSLRIRRAWLEPDGNLNPEARRVIEHSDMLVIGPSSVYTSAVATLLVRGMSEAIQRTRSPIVFISSTFYNEIAETGPTRLSEQVAEIEQYLPRPINVVIYDKYAPDEEAARKAREEKHLVLLEKDPEHIPNHRCLGALLRDPRDRMSIKKLGEILSACI